jgi:histidinol dehydrogenase
MSQEEGAAMAPLIETAGEILDGFYTPFVAANYCIGITAVLPTNGFARSFSGITSRNFVRSTSYARLDRGALDRLLPTIEAIGEAEGLPNHVAGARAS